MLLQNYRILKDARHVLGKDHDCKMIMFVKLMQHYQVRSPRKARRPSAMVLTSGSFIILPAAFDFAASSAPLGSAAKIRMAGLMDFAAKATPDIRPPPAQPEMVE